MSISKKLWVYLINFTLFNVLAVYLLGLRYLQPLQLPHSIVAKFFLFALFVGHLGVAVLIAACLLPAVIYKLFSYFTSAKYIAALLPPIIMVLILFYQLIDTMVFNNYHFHFNGFFLQMLLSGAGGQIFDLSSMEWAIAIVIILLIVLLEIILSFYVWRRVVVNAKCLINKLWRRVIACFIALMFVLSHLINAWGYANFNPSIISMSHTVPFYYGLTARNFMQRHHLLSTKAISAEHTNAYSGSSRHLDYPEQPIVVAKDQHKLPNILFLVIDTWRADAMSQATSPNIDKFASENWNFLQHWSGGDCTQPGIFSLFYALPASYWQAMYNTQTQPVFITQLQRLGYTMFIHASADLTVPPFQKTVFAHVSPLQLRSDGQSSWQRDKYINDKLLQFIASPKAKQKPFFGFLFYDAVHGYSYPPTMPLQFKPTWKHVDRLLLSKDFDRTPYFNIYKNAVYYDDSLLGKVFAALKQQKLLQNTIVVITADHGESFNDYHHNYWGHASNFAASEMHIPLIIHWPNSGPKVIAKYTSHFDIVPTIMQRGMGVKSPASDYSVGSDLLTGAPWKFLLVGSYQRLGLIDHSTITTFYRGGYTKTTASNLDSTKDRPNPQYLRQAFDQMQKFYAK